MSSYFDAKTLEQLSASKPEPSQMQLLERFCEVVYSLSRSIADASIWTDFDNKERKLILPDILAYESVSADMDSLLRTSLDKRVDAVYSTLISIYFPSIKQTLAIHRNYGLNEATLPTIFETHAQILQTYFLNNPKIPKKFPLDQYENRSFFRIDLLKKGRGSFRGRSADKFDEIFASLFSNNSEFITFLFNWLSLIARFILSASLSNIYRSNFYQKQSTLNIEVNSFLHRIQEVIVTNNLNISRDLSQSIITYFMEYGWSIPEIKLYIMNREIEFHERMDMATAITRETNYGNAVLNRKIFWQNHRGENIYPASISLYPVTQLLFSKKDHFVNGLPKEIANAFESFLRRLTKVNSVEFVDNHYKITFTVDKALSYFQNTVLTGDTVEFTGFLHDILWRKWMFSEITALDEKTVLVRFLPYADILNYQFSVGSVEPHYKYPSEYVYEKVEGEQNFIRKLNKFRETTKAFGFARSFTTFVPQLHPLFFDKSDPESPMVRSDSPLYFTKNPTKPRGYYIHAQKYTWVRVSETADFLIFKFINEVDVLNKLASRIRDEFLQSSGLLAKLRPQLFAEEYDGTRGTMDMGLSIAHSIRRGKRMLIQTFKRSKKEEPAYVFIAFDTTKLFPATAVPYAYFLMNVFTSLFEGRIKKLVYGSIGTWSVFPHDDVETYLLRNITGDISGFDYIAQRIIPNGYPLAEGSIADPSEERERQLRSATSFTQKKSWAKECWNRFKYAIIVDNWSNSMKDWSRFEKIPPEYLYQVALDFCRDKYRSFFSYNLSLEFLDNMEIMKECLKLIPQIEESSRKYDRLKAADPNSESTRNAKNELLSIRNKFAHLIVYRKQGKPKRFNQNKYHKEYSYITPSHDLNEIYNSYSASQVGEAHMLEDLCVHPSLYLKGLKYYLIISSLRLSEGYGERFYNSESHQWESIGAIASFVYWLETVAQRSDVRLLFVWVMDEMWEKKILGTKAGEFQTVSRSAIAQRYLEMDTLMNEKKYRVECPDVDEYELNREASSSMRRISYNDWVRLLTLAIRYGDITESEKALVRMVIDGSNFPFMEVGLKSPLVSAKDVGIPDKEFDVVFNQELKEGRWISTQTLRDPDNFVADSLWNLSWFNPWSKHFEAFPNCYENMKIRTFYRFYGWVLHNWEKVYITKPNRMVEISDVKAILDKIKDQKFIV